MRLVDLITDSCPLRLFIRLMQERRTHDLSPALSDYAWSDRPSGALSLRTPTAATHLKAAGRVEDVVERPLEVFRQVSEERLMMLSIQPLSLLVQPPVSRQGRFEQRRHSARQG